MESEYPDGKCEYCGKIFTRPHKFRTETEAFHVHGCNLERIKKIINSKEYDEFIIYDLIDELKDISKISSFGAHRQPYWDRMVEAEKLIKKLEGELDEKNNL